MGDPCSLQSVLVTLALCGMVVASSFVLGWTIRGARDRAKAIRDMVRKVPCEADAPDILDDLDEDDVAL